MEFRSDILFKYKNVFENDDKKFPANLQLVTNKRKLLFVTIILFFIFTRITICRPFSFKMSQMRRKTGAFQQCKNDRCVYHCDNKMIQGS